MGEPRGFGAEEPLAESGSGGVMAPGGVGSRLAPDRGFRPRLHWPWPGCDLTCWPPMRSVRESRALRAPIGSPPVSQALKIVLALSTFLVGITLAHGIVNLGWMEGSERSRLTVGHLPVT